MAKKYKFVTLGPSGTNHEMIAKKYIEQRNIAAEVILVEDFFIGLEMVYNDEADFLFQVAVHPDCSNVVAKAHFHYGIHLIDTFISPSKDLGIVTRCEINNPKTLALQPATANYTDISAWEEHIPVSSIMNIAQGLLEGKYDSGITTIEFAESHPRKLRVDVFIGSLDDPWLVFGKKRVANGEPIIWPDAPIVKQFQS